MGNRGYLIVGDGGHARVVAATLVSIQRKVVKFLDAEEDDTWLTENTPAHYSLAMGLGMAVLKPIGSLIHRVQIAEDLLGKGWTFPNIQHHSAVMAPDVALGKNIQVMAGAVVQCGTRINSHVIVNTRASIDHDCDIGFGAHICPGAVLCGDVRIGKATMVGAAAVVLPGVQIGDYAIVGAGAVITRDVPNEAKAIGVW